MESPSTKQQLTRWDTLYPPQFYLLSACCASVYLLTGVILSTIASRQESWWALRRWHRRTGGCVFLCVAGHGLVDVCFWPAVWVGIMIYTIFDRKPAGYHLQMELEEWYGSVDDDENGGTRGTSGMRIVLERHRLRRMQSREEEDEKRRKKFAASEMMNSSKVNRMGGSSRIIVSISKVLARVWRQWRHWPEEVDYELQDLGALRLPSPVTSSSSCRSEVVPTMDAAYQVVMQ